METRSFFLRRRSWVIGFGCVIVLFLLVGFYRFDLGQKTPERLLEPVVRGDIENYISATGTLEPKRYVEVGAQISGQIKKIHVEEGQQVSAGDLLVEIDATVFETQVQNSEASLEGKRADLEQLEAELELAELRAKRNVNLHARNAVSADTLLESQANVKILKAQINGMEAQIRADSASLAGDKATLGYAKIYAPIGGTVVSLSVREGQTLNDKQSAPLLMEIADLNTLTLRANVSEADVTRLHKSMEVYFKTFGGGERRWYSTVRQVLPTPSVVNDVVLYQALIDVENTDGQLMDAMTTQVYFVLGSAHDALTIPLGAVQGRGRRSQVARETVSGIEMVPVQLGVRNRTHVEVVSGLSEGDEVVVGERIAAASGDRQEAAKTLGGPPGPPGGGPGRRF